MTLATLVNATDLVQWANRRDAQDTLPQVIRRLVHATVDRVFRAEFRAGEGVQFGGWDGIVESERGNAFVPDGTSAWEVGVGLDVKAKADGDYKKRTAEPLGITPSQSTFVFVTPRRWRDKHQWENDRRGDGTWHDVRAYDADDLEHWLDTAPAVHVWISILVGRHPQAAEDLSTYWDNWSAATNPPTSPDLVLAGRQPILEHVHAWLEPPTAPLVLRGESRAEAIAVFAAAIQKLAPDRREGVLSRVVLVHDLPSWNQLTVSDGRLALIAGFDCDSVAIGRAIQKKHSLVLPLGHADTLSSQALDIPRLSGQGVGKILVENGVAEDKARDLAALARRSLTTLRRKLAVLPEIEQPAWSYPERARSLLPALLAGRWSSDTEADRQALATLAGTTYNQVNSDFVRWSNENDPPVRCTGTTWYLTSEEDAWSLLGRFLTIEDLNRFQQIAIDALGPPDPSFDLPDDKRWMAGVIGPRPSHSGLLRSGIAHTLAILGARGNGIRITGGSTLESFSRRPVVKLLDTSDWKVWASLPLELLAEAAPDEFLNAVDSGVTGDQPFLLGLFRDKDADLFSSAPHTGLLFALEALAWSRDYLARTATALARLASIDPGGSWANRPLASLRSVFLLWSPQTTGTLAERFAAIDLIRQREPDIAWKVMRSILPQHMDSSHPTARPRWREWGFTKDVRITAIEQAQGIHELVGRMLHDVGIDGTRWSDLIESLSQLPRDQYDAVVTKLECLELQQLSTTDAAVLWNALRTLVSRHRSHADADWAFPKSEVDRLAGALARLEPQDPLLRCVWLFSDNPALPEGCEEDWHEYQRLIAERQCDAVEILHRQRNLSFVSELVQKCDRPGLIGAALARSSCSDVVADDLLREYLCAAEQRHRQFVAGFIDTKVHIAGIPWAQQKLAAMLPAWSPTERAMFCACLSFEASTWALVEAMDETTISEYWRTVSPFYVKPEGVEVAAQRLLDHARPTVAADLLQHHLRKASVSVALVASVLEGLVGGLADAGEQRHLSAYDLSDLLTYVSASNEIEETRIAKLEWAFLPAIGRHHYKPKILLQEMARSPEFFAQVIALVYRAEGEETRESSNDDKARWERAYELLQSWRWRPLPGNPESAEIDPTALREWVLKARELLRTQGRLAIGDNTIGEILSGAGGGEDGVWPHPTVRDLVEELASQEFEQGLMIGVLNSGGLSWRNPNEGGTQERRTAAQYDRFAGTVNAKWPRTAAMLRGIRDHYLASADCEDQRAEIREDLLQ